MTTAKAPQRTCILVLGMHRSGTSALAGVLSRLGADLPATPMKSHETNARGFYESEKIWQLHERLLSSAGSSWSDWQEFNPDWVASPRAAEYRERALKLLDEEYGSSRLFVLKDPRICRLMPFWKSVLAEAGIAPVVMHIHRNPLEVAASLHKRDGIDQGYGQLLWLRHLLEAEHHSRDLPRYFTSYPLVLHGWGRVATEAGQALGIGWPRLSDKVGSEIDSFLSPELQHHSGRPDSISSDPTLSSWLRDGFEIVERWSARGEDHGDRKRLDKILKAMNRAGPAFGRLLHRGREAAAKLAQTEAELAQVSSTLEVRAEDAARALEVARGEAHARIVQLETEAAAGEAALRARLEEAETARAELDTRLVEDRKAAAEALKAARGEAHARIVQLETEAAAGEAALRARLEEAETARAELDTRLAEDRKAAAEALKAARGEAQARIVQLETEAAAGEAALRSRLEEAETARAELDTRLAEDRKAAAEALKAARGEAQAREAELRAALADSDANLVSLREDLARSEQRNLTAEERLAETIVARSETARAAAAQADRFAEERRTAQVALDAARRDTLEQIGLLEDLHESAGKQLAALEKRIAGKDADLAALQRRLQDGEAAQRQLEALDPLRDEIDSLRAQVDFLNSALAQRSQEASDWSDQTAALGRQLEAQATAAAGQEAELDGVRARLAGQVALAERRGSEIATLRSQLDETSGALHRQTAEADAARAQAKHAATQQAADLAALRRELGEAQAREARIKADRDETLARLSGEVEALTRMRDELHASSSWRITAPMRWLSRRLRRY